MPKAKPTLDNLAARNRQKTHCPKGHPYDEANTTHSAGRRHCRTCNRERSYARYAARKGREAPRVENGNKTHCPRGHPYVEGNLYRYRGRRVCRTCRIERSKAYYHRKVGT